MSPHVSAHAATVCAVLALAQLSPSPTLATSVCSVDQIRTINVNIGTTVGVSACWMPALIATPTAWGAQVCAHRADCVPVLESVADELPDCAINGVYVVKDAVNEVIAYCEQVLATNASSTSSSTGSNIINANNATGTSASTDGTANSTDASTNNTTTTAVSDSNSNSNSNNDNSNSNNSNAATSSTASASASSATDIQTSDNNSAAGSTTLTVAATLAVAAQIMLTLWGTWSSSLH